jgi:hypothetical protein
MLVQEFEPQLIRPPILVRGAAADCVGVTRYRALASFIHDFCSFVCAIL